MTREEAIKELSYIADDMPSMECADWIVAISMGIKALEQEPCTDAISRQAVLDALDKSKYSNEFCKEHHIDWSINLGMAHIAVNELKLINPNEKVGHWIYDKIRYWNGGCKYECSECGMGSDVNYAYCMRCGCKMQEGEE